MYCCHCEARIRISGRRVTTTWVRSAPSRSRMARTCSSSASQKNSLLITTARRRRPRRPPRRACPTGSASAWSRVDQPCARAAAIAAPSAALACRRSGRPARQRARFWWNAACSVVLPVLCGPMWSSRPPSGRRGTAVTGARPDAAPVHATRCPSLAEDTSSPDARRSPWLSGRREARGPGAQRLELRLRRAPPVRGCGGDALCADQQAQDRERQGDRRLRRHMAGSGGGTAPVRTTAGEVLRLSEHRDAELFESLTSSRPRWASWLPTSSETRRGGCTPAAGSACHARVAPRRTAPVAELCRPALLELAVPVLAAARLRRRQAGTARLIAQDQRSRPQVEHLLERRDQALRPIFVRNDDRHVVRSQGSGPAPHDLLLSAGVGEQTRRGPVA